MYIDDELSINNPVFSNSKSEVSCWTWDQRHNGEQDFCFSLIFTHLERKGGQIFLSHSQ